MKNVSKLLILVLSLLMVRCDSPSSSTPSVTVSSGQMNLSSPQQVIVTAQPTPTPTPLTDAQLNVILKQKISDLKIGLGHQTQDYKNDWIVMPITVDGVIQNISDDPGVATNDPLGVHFKITDIQITSGDKDASNKYITAYGTMNISNSGYHVNPAYQSMSTGLLYFTIRNDIYGPFGNITWTQNYGFNGQSSNYQFYPCGVLTFYSDAEMTHQVNQLSHYTQCVQ